MKKIPNEQGFITGPWDDPEVPKGSAARWWMNPPDFEDEEPPLDQTRYWYQLFQP